MRLRFWRKPKESLSDRALPLIERVSDQALGFELAHVIAQAERGETHLFVTARLMEGLVNEVAVLGDALRRSEVARRENAARAKQWQREYEKQQRLVWELRGRIEGRLARARAHFLARGAV